MSLENVKAFYERLAKDEAFRTKMQGVTTKDECSQLVKSAGYDFTQEEFEKYTTQILESSFENSEMQDLNQEELEAVFGGASLSITDKWRPIQPLYGVIYPPKLPPVAQPLYGVIIPDDIA